MSNDRLPSLDLIKGFEAAARRLSFTQAAEELFLTQSAVSRQIKALEEQLGTALFQRRHRQLVLTAAGEELYRAATDALHTLAAATAKIRDPGAGRVLTVSSTIGLTSLWLIPRLADFRSLHPDIDIRIDANNRLIDLEREAIEVAIRYCTPAVAPESAIRLFGEDVLPICSPALIKRSGPIRTVRDLERQVLLHYERPGVSAPWLTWTVWMEAMQVGKFRAAGSLRFSQFDQVIQAAIDGQGVALGTTPLVRQLIRSRKLVAPLGRAAKSSRVYYLVVGAGAATRPDVKQFVAWLLRQAEEEARSAALSPPGRRQSAP